MGTELIAICAWCGNVVPPGELYFLAEEYRVACVLCKTAYKPKLLRKDPYVVIGPHDESLKESQGSESSS